MRLFRPTAPLFPDLALQNRDRARPLPGLEDGARATYYPVRSCVSFNTPVRVAKDLHFSGRWVPAFGRLQQLLPMRIASPRLANGFLESPRACAALLAVPLCGVVALRPVRATRRTRGLEHASASSAAHGSEASVRGPHLHPLLRGLPRHAVRPQKGPGGSRAFFVCFF